MKAINTQEYLEEAWQALQLVKDQFIFAESELNKKHQNLYPVESELIYNIGQKIWFSIKVRIGHETMFQSF